VPESITRVAEPSGDAPLHSAIYNAVFAAMDYKNVIKVLLLPDYVETAPRLTEGAAIWGELQMLMP
jgi:hypothetical protein